MIIGMRDIKRAVGFGVVLALAMLFVGCSTDTKSYLVSEGVEYDDNALLTMTFNLPKLLTSGETTYPDEEGKEEGVGYENYIDIEGGDYRIYFFHYNESSYNDDKSSTLIARFTPDEVQTIYGTDNIEYVATGKMAAELLDDDGFKVVMLAGWGEEHYPDVAGTITPGVTTIDDICGKSSDDPDLARYNAFVGEDSVALLPSKTLHIPFFGLQEYPAGTLAPGRDITLSEPINMLRAVAKVEVSMESGDPAEIVGVWIVGYNKQGYSAPTDVYDSDDLCGYSHNSNAFQGELHLINGANDTDARDNIIKFSNKEDPERWVCYLPEYENLGDDFAFIVVQLLDFDGYYGVCFADYTDGEQTSYKASSDGGGEIAGRWDILRNRYFSFELAEYYLRTASDDPDSRSGSLCGTDESGSRASGDGSDAVYGAGSASSSGSGVGAGSASGSGSGVGAGSASSSGAAPAGVDMENLEEIFPGIKFVAPKSLTVTEYN